MICEKCGQWMEDGTTVCSKCGAVYQKEEAGSAASAETAGGGAPVAAAGNTAAEAAPVAPQPGVQGGNQQAGQGMPAMANAYGESAGPMRQPGMTKQEFDKHTNIVNVKKQISGMGIACYVIAGINVILAVLMGNLGGLLDIVLMAGMGLGIHLAKSRACSVILTVYGGINVLTLLLTTGRLAGWWILLVGIYAIINTFKYQKAWAEYQKTGIVPDLSAGKAKK